MNQDLLASRAALMRAVAREAGARALIGFQTRAPGSYRLKGPQDPVTEADEAVEAFIRAEIGKGFPGDGFLGEETGQAEELAQSDGLWVVDPIDGTDNFARGIPHFCVSIAWICQGKVQLGAIYNPVTCELYEAEKGQGARKNGQPISVSKTPSMAAAAIELGWSTRVARGAYIDTVVRLLDFGANVRRSGSGALALAWVAEGRIDGYAELHMNAWDCLAGLLLVNEAGGMISKPPSLVPALNDGGLVFASNRAVGPALLDALAIESAA